MIKLTLGQLDIFRLPELVCISTPKGSKNMFDKIFPLNSLFTVDIATWCHHYSKYGPYKQEANIRYYIGIYQLGQGVIWEGSDSEYESYASAAIHIIGATEMLELSRGIEEYLPMNLKELEYNGMQYKALLKHIATGMQYMHYRVTCGNILSRKLRFEEENYLHEVASIVRILFGAIPVDKRLEAITLASKIMIGAL